MVRKRTHVRLFLCACQEKGGPVVDAPFADGATLLKVLNAGQVQEVN